MVRPEPHQPLDKTDIRGGRGVEARLGFVLDELLRQRRLVGSAVSAPAQAGRYRRALAWRRTCSSRRWPAASFWARCASFCWACCSARKSKTARAAAPLDGNVGRRSQYPGGRAIEIGQNGAARIGGDGGDRICRPDRSRICAAPVPPLLCHARSSDSIPPRRVIIAAWREQQMTRFIVAKVTLGNGENPVKALQFVHLN